MIAGLLKKISPLEAQEAHNLHMEEIVVRTLSTSVQL